MQPEYIVLSSLPDVVGRTMALTTGLGGYSQSQLSSHKTVPHRPSCRNSMDATTSRLLHVEAAIIPCSNPLGGPVHGQCRAVTRPDITDSLSAAEQGQGSHPTRLGMISTLRLQEGQKNRINTISLKCQSSGTSVWPRLWASIDCQSTAGSLAWLD